MELFIKPPVSSQDLTSGPLLSLSPILQVDQRLPAFVIMYSKRNTSFLNFFSFFGQRDEKKSSKKSLPGFLFICWAGGVEGQGSWSGGRNASLPQWAGGVSAVLPRGAAQEIGPTHQTPVSLDFRPQPEDLCISREA